MTNYLMIGSHKRQTAFLFCKLLFIITIFFTLLGAFVGRWLVADVDDDRAKGLALGLTSHAFGTVEAWQISPVAGRYATFGLAVNGIVTAIWFPLAYQAWQAWT